MRSSRALRAWILFGCVVPLCGWSDGASRGAEGWTVVGESDGVTVATRRVGGSAYPEVRASATVCAELPSLVDYIEDAAGFDRWIPDTEESRMLARPAMREQIFYIRTSMPWPIKDRDMIYRLTEPAAKTGDGWMTVWIEGLPDYLPTTSGAVRMTSVRGRWNFHEQAGRTHIDLEMHFEPGGRIPAWLASRRIVAMPSKMLANLQREFASGCQRS